MEFTGKENPNFKFKNIDEKYKEKAKNYLPLNEDDRQILYSYQSLHADMVIIVFWDKRDNKIYILRLFKVADKIASSLDVERSLKL